jgi:hypothetical protein
MDTGFSPINVKHLEADETPSYLDSLFKNHLRRGSH